jgi:hypothetical protein
MREALAWRNQEVVISANSELPIFSVGFENPKTNLGKARFDIFTVLRWEVKETGSRVTVFKVFD